MITSQAQVHVCVAKLGNYTLFRAAWKDNVSTFNKQVDCVTQWIFFNENENETKTRK